MPDNDHEHDVFLSYTHDDSDWVKTFVKELKNTFNQREPRRKIRIWFDESKLKGGDQWEIEVENAIHASRALLAVTSPAYYGSEPCGKEREAFLRKHQASEQSDSQIPAQVHAFIKVEKLPYPEVDFLPKIIAIKFHNESIEFPKRTQKFKLAMAMVAVSIQKILERLSRRAISIYLGKGSNDVEEYIGRLKREFIDQGYNLMPNIVLDMYFDVSTISAQLAPCALAIFVVGSRLDDFARKSIQVALDNGKQVIIWFPRTAVGAEPEAVRHSLLANLEALAEQCRSQLEIVANLSSIHVSDHIKRRLADAVPAPAAPAQSEPSQLSVYLLFERSFDAEQKLADQIKPILASWNLRVLEARDLTAHSERMRTCDAVLLLRAESSPDDQWLSYYAPSVIFGKKEFEKSQEFLATALLISNPSRLATNYRDAIVVEYSKSFQESDLFSFKAKILGRAQGA